ncbi:hypothetical protein HMPREF9538_03980 [Klebsiella sp. MS 92-3]|nr:hypothetical protein HMPREF9538_03980 [Klebsiella sp. MS 92-3]
MQRCLSFSDTLLSCLYVKRKRSKYHLSDVCFYITLSLGLISYKSVILLAVGRVN